MPVFGIIRRLRCWVLVSFLLSLGMASAAPWLQPPRMDPVCRGVGVSALASADPDAGGVQDLAGMQCAACLPTGLPPSVHQPALGPVPVGDGSPLCLIDFLVVSTTAAPPPGRGPPLFASVQKR